MLARRKILYVIVSGFPYGNREAFFEAELEVLAARFEKIFLVIPEGKEVDFGKATRNIPSNVSVVFLNVHNSGTRKLSGLLKIFLPALLEEIRFIRRRCGQAIRIQHLKTMLGYSSMAMQIAVELEKHIHRNGFNAKELCLYSYWLSYASTAIAWLKKKNPRYKCITRVHGWDCFFDRAPGQYLPLRPWTIRLLDQTLAVSKCGADYLLNLLGRERYTPKISNHYLGIDQIEKPGFRISERNKVHLISIAFVDPVKQLERIVDSLLKIKDINILWTHIGGGAALSELKRYTSSRINSENRIQVEFTGDMSKNGILEFLSRQQPDALLCTSRSEGLPVSMMEAMAHGIPVISVDVGGICEIVKHEFNGILLPPSATAEELAIAIERFVSLPESVRMSWKENAFETYSKQFVGSKNYTLFVNDWLS